jgi:hypothetical protein
MDDERRAGRRRAHGRRDRGVVRASSEDVRGAGESAMRSCEEAAPRSATWVRYNLERAYEGLGGCQVVGASASVASRASICSR